MPAPLPAEPEQATRDAESWLAVLALHGADDEFDLLDLGVRTGSSAPRIRGFPPRRTPTRSRAIASDDPRRCGIAEWRSVS